MGIVTGVIIFINSKESVFFYMGFEKMKDDKR